MRKIAVDRTAGPVDQNTINEAVNELAAEVRKGKQVDQALLEEIAGDFGMNPVLLDRKFKERFPNGVGDAVPTEQQNAENKVQQALQKYLEYNPGAKNRTMEVLRGNGKWLVVARDGYRLLGIWYKDAQRYWFDANTITGVIDPRNGQLIPEGELRQRLPEITKFLEEKNSNG